MIYYFTATGNSQHIAEKLSEMLEDNIQEINLETVIKKDEKIILVIPNYFWGVPKIVFDLLNKTVWEKQDKVYIVFTYGGFIGSADRQIERLVSPGEGFTYCLKMVTNYIISYKIDDEITIRKKLKKADENLKKVVNGIYNSNSSYHSSAFLLPLGLLFQSLYHQKRKTKKFYATSRCISCGKCATNCVDQAIRIINGKPRWIKSRCQLCLKCIHLCPVEAIEYGKSTVGRSRYQYRI